MEPKSTGKGVNTLSVEIAMRTFFEGVEIRQSKALGLEDPIFSNNSKKIEEWVDKA